MTADAISPDLKTVLRRLKLGRMLDTLPERLVLARQQKMPHQDFLTLVASDDESDVDIPPRMPVENSFRPSCHNALKVQN